MIEIHVYIIEPLLETLNLNFCTVYIGSTPTISIFVFQHTTHATFIIYYFFNVWNSHKFHTNFSLCLFTKQVSFIAINCWTGSCRQNGFFHSYPQLFFHHTSYNPLKYMGKHKTGYLVNCPLLVNFNDLFCGILASLISFKALVQIVFVIPCWKHINDVLKLYIFFHIT